MATGVNRYTKSREKYENIKTNLNYKEHIKKIKKNWREKIGKRRLKKIIERNNQLIKELRMERMMKHRCIYCDKDLFPIYKYKSCIECRIKARRYYK